MPNELLSEELIFTKENKPPKFSAKALLKAMRPKQWIKNLLLFAAVLFSDTKMPRAAWFSNPNLAELAPLVIACAAFVIFSMLASGVYLINDLRDVERDRQHPKKRNRPIAAGLVSEKVALVTAILLWVGAAAFGGYLHLAHGIFGWKFGFLCALYVAIQFAYSTNLKNVAILDVFLLASGFVIRAMAGAAAVEVYISMWLVVCTGFLSLLIGFGKRRHEVLLLGDDRGHHRATLSAYTLPMLDQFVTICTGAAIVTYTIYTIQSKTAEAHQRLYWTIVPVVYAVFRYLYIMQKGDRGGAPENDLLEDKHILACLVLWVILTYLALRVNLRLPGPGIHG